MSFGRLVQRVYFRGVCIEGKHEDHASINDQHCFRQTFSGNYYDLMLFVTHVAGKTQSGSSSSAS